MKIFSEYPGLSELHVLVQFLFCFLKGGITIPKIDQEQINKHSLHSQGLAELESSSSQ